ncbi:MAG: type IX secretion system sortase PorU, partial [Bacteroidetes bacterium]|nr:type IX secretion system sortase PorU [Bacteroidota bacterium]
DAVIGIENKNAIAIASLIPLRKNIQTGMAEKLVSATIEIQLTPFEKNKSTRTLNKKGPQTSLLKDGTWYKLGVEQTGVYKLDYNYLKNLGLDMNNINPTNIHIYGKPNGIIPQLISVARDSDLVENAITIVGEADGKFDQGDYILFYGQEPTRWAFSNSDKHFHHKINDYSDTTYYFITANSTKGKRVGVKNSLTNIPDNTITKYDAYAHHELDQLTEINKNVKSGREWWGEEYDKVTSYDFSFGFTNLDQSHPIYMRTRTAARSVIESGIDFTVNNNKIYKALIEPIREEFLFDYAIDDVRDSSFLVSSNTININTTYNKPSTNSIAWLNYIELNARCNLNFNGGQFGFRDATTIGVGKTNKFVISNANSNVTIWDVTNFHNVQTQQSNLNGSDLSFITEADNLKEFVAFDGSSFLTPTSSIKIPNQDLHGLAPAKFIIITHPDFKEAANKIADFHRKQDNMNVIVTTTQPIYNEFSGGAQDISAIRDFTKMLYDRAIEEGSDTPRYVMFMGDASYDPKNRIKSNTNFIPIYESPYDIFGYIGSVGAYCTDDFFGFMDGKEGNLNSQDLMDVGIGRLPVRTLEQANDMANKIINYASNKSYGDWKNIATFLADDEDSNIYLNACEDITNDGFDNIKKRHPVVNVDKLYLDAYPQISTPSGARYPDVQDAINKRMNAGTLSLSYQGHGGENGLAHERVVEIDDINTWSNYNKLAVFVTATCEFARVDDPARISAGELVILNPKGGAVAMLTTVRTVEASQNAALTNNVFFNNIYSRDDDKPRRFGDIVRTAKNRTGLNPNTICFTLLGDPALRIGIAEKEVHTSGIYTDTSKQKVDTLNALTKVTVEGYVSNYKDTLNIDKTFNGVIYPTVFDKEKIYTTLANDPASYKQQFKMQKNIIYKGKALVKDGKFTFSFIMPKDISFTNSKGKISYYANTENVDAAGYDTNIIIGGFSKNHFAEDGKGPEIEMWINDTTFISGGLTNQNPILIARLYDDVGINTSGNGIGHDITGRLNGGDAVVMNNYYQASLNDYRKGEVQYPFANLADGKYRLNLKVWDVANNSAEDFIDFVVLSSKNFKILKVFNYPNPFTDKTTFTFEHNATNDDLDVEINIYSLKGQNVKNILTKPTDAGLGTKVATITWNGGDDTGGPMASGVYLYRLTAKTKDGQTAFETKKLVIIK